MGGGLGDPLGHVAGTRRAPARTAASTSRSLMARQIQTYIDVSTPVPCRCDLLASARIGRKGDPVKWT